LRRPDLAGPRPRILEPQPLQLPLQTGVWPDADRVRQIRRAAVVLALLVALPLCADEVRTVIAATYTARGRASAAGRRTKIAGNRSIDRCQTERDRVQLNRRSLPTQA